MQVMLSWPTKCRPVGWAALQLASGEGQSRDTADDSTTHATSPDRMALRAPCS